MVPHTVNEDDGCRARVCEISTEKLHMEYGDMVGAESAKQAEATTMSPERTRRYCCHAREWPYS